MNREDMLLRLIELEEEKIRTAADAPKLAPHQIEAVKNRLLAEKDTILAEFERTGALSAQKKSKAGKTWAVIGVAAALVIGAGVVTLFRGAQGIDAQVVIAKGGVKANGQPLSAGLRLQKDMVLTTEAKAIAVAKWDEPLWAVVGQNSKVAVQKMERTGGKPSVELDHANGLAFVAVDKSRAEFTLRTPTMVLIVRGTAFSVEASAAGIVVSVLEGLVESRLENKFLETVKDTAAREKLSQPLLIQPKQKFVVSLQTKAAVVSALSEAEIANLTKLNKIIALAKEKLQATDQKRAAAIDAEVGTLSGEIYAAAAVGAGKPAEKLTLADIRAKYGKVSRVNLKNGKSYVGFFTLQGANMQIVTPYGTVRVPTSELAGVEDM